MDVSVIVPTYQRRHLLVRTLPALCSQNYPARQYEIVLVVDGATDGSTDFAKTLHSPCRLKIIEQPNRGQAAARNAGLHAATGRLVLFLDDDILCDPDLVGQHVRAHQTSSASLVFGPIETVPNDRQTLVTDWTRMWCDDYFAKLSRADGLAAGGAITVNNTSLPHSILAGCGGFDETFFRAYEDLDLLFRLKKDRIEFRYEPKALTKHQCEKTVYELVDDAAWDGRGEILMCRKHPEYWRISRLRSYAEGSLPRRLLFRLAAAAPLIDKIVLRPLFVLISRPPGTAFRRLGIMLLRIRLAFGMLRGAVRESGSLSAFYAEFRAKRADEAVGGACAGRLF